MNYIKNWNNLKVKTKISSWQRRETKFCFMPGRCTTDAIAVLRMSMEKYREKQRALYMVFIDLKKAFDQVPRQEVWRSMREKGVPEKYVLLVQNIYKDVDSCKIQHWRYREVYSKSWAPPMIGS
jgi:hypothetical protein